MHSPRVPIRNVLFQSTSFEPSIFCWTRSPVTYNTVQVPVLTRSKCLFMNSPTTDAGLRDRRETLVCKDILSAEIGEAAAPPSLRRGEMLLNALVGLFIWLVQSFDQFLAQPVLHLQFNRRVFLSFVRYPQPTPTGGWYGMQAGSTKDMTLFGCQVGVVMGGAKRWTGGDDPLPVHFG